VTQDSVEALSVEMALLLCTEPVGVSTGADEQPIANASSGTAQQNVNLARIMSVSS
jgi:hypothetical protein